LKVLLSEIPHYLFWLVNTFELPATLISTRYGVTHFHHPDVSRLLRTISPEHRLLQYFDTAKPSLVAGENKPWTGTVAELRRVLLSSSVAQQVKQLAAAGFLATLTRLAQKAPERVVEAANGKLVISPRTA